MAVPNDVAAELLVKCGRCCCLCRRFRPIQLQVHHIVERNAGGTDEFDNLIALCLTCHTDVHTEAPFTRRFTVAELKLHRAHVLEMVAAGTLPAGDPALRNSVLVEASVAFRGLDIIQGIGATAASGLTPVAVEILTSAAQTDGHVAMYTTSGGTAIQVGGRVLNDRKDRRSIAEYRHAVDQLVESTLLEPRGHKGEVFWVTHEGYLLADELLAAGGSHTDET